MNAMKYVFPIMIFAMGRSFPAGLALYWSIGNIFTVVQTMILNKVRRKQKIKDEALAEARKNLKNAAN